MVFAGAHLDSVPAGPGVNDDGSGTAFQLELAEQLAKPGTPPRNKIRFLWFGGEEDGLVGSQYYAAHLSQAEVDRTDMMLDTDMIASSNFARLVYDGDGSTFGAELAGPAGSGKVEAGPDGLLGRARPLERADPVRRTVRLRGLRQSRHPVRRRVRRRRGAQDGRAGRHVRRRGGRAAGPVLPRGLRQLRHADGPAAGDDDERLRGDPNPANLASQQQANSLRGNALRSLTQFKGTLVHAVWYFARSKDAFSSKATTAKAKKATSARTGSRTRATSALARAEADRDDRPGQPMAGAASRRARLNIRMRLRSGHGDLLGAVTAGKS